MFTAEYLADYINKAIDQIKYPEQPAGLFDPIKYAMGSGGKRLRPVLTLGACAALGADISAVRNQALGVEMYHNFTLLHDDVMDRADMRRGRPTVHRKWNESTAILSGDAMLTMAGQLMSRCDATITWRVMELFNTTTMEVYEGQQYDMDFENRMDVTVDEYMEMIRLKTSVLLGCACKLGAIVAGANEYECRALYDYGIKLGLAFQLEDDLLDTFGDPDVFGKNIGGDIVNDKKTWLLISALNSDKHDEICRFIGSDTDAPTKIAKVKAIYEELGLRQQCTGLIETYIDNAIESLRSIEMVPGAIDFFVKIAQDSLHRTH